VILYGNCALTDVESKYSQTEKEALALICECDRFTLYLYGQHSYLVSDQKPLEVTFGHYSKSSARIQRWVLTLEVVYYQSGIKTWKVKYCRSFVMPATHIQTVEGVQRY
jgi:hypothetical protein